MPGLDLRLARRDLPLPGLQHRAHHDVLDLLGRDVGALERLADGYAAQMRGRERRQAPAQLADRRAGAAQDHGSRHAPSLLTCGADAVTATTDAPPATDADTIVVGVFEDEGNRPRPRRRAAGAGRLRRGQAGLRKLAVTHAEGRRYVVAGLGGRSDFDPERARVAAATVVGRAKELGTKTLCWEVPHHVTDAHAGALVEGTLLASYAYRSTRRRRQRARRSRR